MKVDAFNTRLSLADGSEIDIRGMDVIDERGASAARLSLARGNGFTMTPEESVEIGEILVKLGQQMAAQR